MSDEFDYDDDSSPDDEQPRSKKEENLRVLRQKAKEADDLRARLEQMERHQTLTKAGLADLPEKKVKALIGAHGDGEWTAEALKATAADLWGSDDGETQISAEEAAAIQQITSVGNAAPPPVPTPQSELHAMKRQVEMVSPYQLQQLYGKTLDAVRKAGYVVGQGFNEQVGGFEPTQ